MRLTLRTLLAYLDDVLDPALAKDIGQRIHENSAAQEQVERIREVLRKRRIAAPEIAGPGSGPDPNVVAEYLDNTLAADAIADLEKLCLDSDMHLAEVAASHQILTLVLGEPVDVSPTLRERMYAVGHVPESANGAPAAAAGAVVAATVAPARPEVPEYLRRKPLGPRLTGALLVVLGLGWLFWVLNDQSLRNSVRDDHAVAVIGPNPPAVPDNAVGDPTVEVVPRADLVPPVPDLTQPVNLLAPTTPAVVTETTIAATDGKTAPDMKGNAATPLPPAPMPPVAVPAAPVPAPPVAAKPALPFSQILYTSAEGVALIQTENDWTVLPRRSVIHPGEVIAAPEPFEVQLQVDNGKLELTAMGDTVLRFLAATDTASFGIELLRGRLLINRTSAASDVPVAMQLTVGRREHLISFPEINTTVGFDLIPPQPAGRPVEGMALSAPGSLVVSRGSIALQPTGGALATIRPDAGEISWVELFAGKTQGQLKALPPWMSPEGIKVTPTQKLFARSFEKEFALGQTVSQSIPAVAKSDIARMAEAAVHTLSLTANYRELVRSLQSKHEEARIAAIIGLREWLAPNPLNEVLLTEEVGKVFPDGDVPGVITMLWGFPLSAARDPQTSRQIVDVLTHEDIAIRELGFFHLVMMTGKSYGYKPVLAKGQRDAAYYRWEEHLKKTGGALLPPEN